MEKEKIVKIECPESIWNALIKDLKEESKKELIELIKTRERGISEKTYVARRAKEEFKKLRELLENKW